jgi:hypothetical protein
VRQLSANQLPTFFYRIQRGFCHHQALTNIHPAVTTATRGGTRAVRVTPTVRATTAKREGIKGAVAKARAGIVSLGNTSPQLVDPTADRAKRESTSRTLAGAPADHANLDATTQTRRAPAHIRAKVAALGSTSPAVHKLRVLPARQASTNRAPVKVRAAPAPRAGTTQTVALQRRAPA